MDSIQWNVRPLSPGDIHYLPAGTYYIGDPQWALSEHDYEHIFTIPGIHPGHYKSSRGQIVVDWTYSGPNTYVGIDDKNFTTDSGLIAIISESLIDYIDDAGDVNGGQVYEFLEPLEVICCGGVFTFTTSQESLVINTVLLDDEEKKLVERALHSQTASVVSSVVPNYGLAHGRSQGLGGFGCRDGVAAMTPIPPDVQQLLTGFGGMEIE